MWVAALPLPALHPRRHDIARNPDIWDPSQSVTCHRLHGGETDAAPCTANKEGTHLTGRARTSKPPLLLSHLIGRDLDEVMHIGGRLSILAEDKPSHSRERQEALLDRSRRTCCRVELAIQAPRVRQVMRLHSRLTMTYGATLLITRMCRPVVLCAGMDGLNVE